MIRHALALHRADGDSLIDVLTQSSYDFEVTVIEFECEEEVFICPGTPAPREYLLL